MPTPRSRRIRSSSHQPVHERARYTRTNADMLIGGTYSEGDTFPYSTGPGIDPGSQPPIHWMGLDSGGGAYPIGPNGPYVNGRGGALPVITRAVSLICGPMTAAPFRTIELGFGGRPLGRPRWITDPMLLRPDSRYPADSFSEASKSPRGEFFFGWIRDAVLFGTGAFLAQEDDQGQPMAGSMRRVSPHLLHCERAADGSLRWVIGEDGAAEEDKVVFGRDGRVTLGPIEYRITALRNPHGITDADGHTPGVFEQHPSAFGLGQQIETYASGTFRSGIPAGYLQVDHSMDSMTPEQAADLKRRWMASHGGDRRSIAVLNSFTKFVPLQLSPVDSALGEVTRLNIGSIAYAFGLDPEILGVTMSNSGTYRNATEFWQRHKDYSLSPWLSAVEDVLTALLPGTQGVRVDLDRFANPPPKERFDAYKVAIDAGVLTPNECRELEGLEPLPEPPAEREPQPEPAPVPVPDEAPAPTDIRARRPQPWR
jgi:phage portal protein BeeE